MISLLGIPTHLTGSGDVSLPIAYQKYKAFLAATQTCNQMVRDNSWTLKRPTRVDLIEIFVSKSYYHSHYKAHFPKVTDHPDMVAWLEGQEDRLSNLDLWGIKKVNYTFTDLAMWLANGGTLEVEDDDYVDQKQTKKSKGKGKGKEKEKEKDKEKRKEKGMERKTEKEKDKKDKKKKRSGKMKE
jgi:hypothetical protein